MTKSPDAEPNATRPSAPLRLLKFSAVGLGVTSTIMLIGLFTTQALSAPQDRVTRVALHLLSLGAMLLSVGLWRSRRWALVSGHATAIAALVGGCAGLPLILLGVFTALAMGSVRDSAALLPLVVVLVGIPAFWALLLGRRDLRAAIEHLDPGPSWTDRWSGSWLGLVISLATCAVWAAFTGWNLGGLLAEGLPSRVAGIAIGIVYAASAWGLWRRLRWGWWLALGCSLSLPLALAVAFASGRIPARPGIGGVLDPGASSLEWVQLGAHVANFLAFAPVVIWLLIARRQLFDRPAPTAAVSAPSPH